MADDAIFINTNALLVRPIDTGQTASPGPE
jgi:hypothetical protein